MGWIQGYIYDYTRKRRIFSYSNYFIYSYMKDASYTFTSDNTLAEFIDGFKPAYINGGNKLTLLNDMIFQLIY